MICLISFLGFDDEDTREYRRSRNVYFFQAWLACDKKLVKVGPLNYTPQKAKIQGAHEFLAAKGIPMDPSEIFDHFNV